MRAFSAVYSRELKYYFQSITAYVVISIFLLISGYFFFSLFRYYNLISLQSIQNNATGGELNRPGPTNMVSRSSQYRSSTGWCGSGSWGVFPPRRKNRDGRLCWRSRLAPFKFDRQDGRWSSSAMAL